MKSTFLTATAALALLAAPALAQDKLKIGMTFQEMKTLLESLGFTMSNKGKTSGSRVSFMKGNIPISFHKPHGGEPIKAYVLKAVLETLERMRLI